MSAKLNIFMVGGRRCGKTTVLSKIFRQFNDVLHHEANEGPDLFRINLEAKDIPHLADAEQAIQNDIFHGYGPFDEFQVNDINPTPDMTEIRFNLTPIGDGQSLKIGFRDIPGEWCNSKVLNPATGEIVDNIVTALDVEGIERTKNAIEFVVDYIQYSTVTIIAIDTPAMMEDGGAFNNTINRIGPITQAFKTALESTGGDENKSDKLILFVPLKCEKYVVKGNGTIDDEEMKNVAQKVRESYAELIEIIGENPVLSESVSAAILPIVTIKEVLWYRYGCTWNDIKNSSIKSDNGYPRSFPEYYDSKNCLYSFYKFKNFTLHSNASNHGSKSEFCEQPLVYSLLYAMRHAIFRKAHPAISPKGGPIVIVLKRMLAILHSFLVNNANFKSEADRLSRTKMKRGNGFEIIQDKRRLLG